MNRRPPEELTALSQAPDYAPIFSIWFSILYDIRSYIRFWLISSMPVHGILYTTYVLYRFNFAYYHIKVHIKSPV